MKPSVLRRGLYGLLTLALLASQACTTQPGERLSSLAALKDEAPARRSLDIQQWRTPEGARVLFVEARELPMFDLRLTFAAGSSQDRGVHGLALMTNAMLNEGIRGRDADAIAAGFESLGAQFGNGAYRDMAVASLRSLSDPQRREPALELFSEVVGRPMFPSDALTRVRNQVLSSIEFNKKNPGKLASQALFDALYGPHPYGHSSEGTAKSLNGIRQAQLRDFHRRAYTAGNAVIALVGDLSRSEAEAIAAQVSRALPAGRALAKTAEPVAPAPVHRHVEFPSNQTHLQIAQLGIPRGHPDYAALFLGNQVLGGGGFGSRLMEEVREKRGLTYGIYSGFSPMQTRGPFMISMQTRADYTEGSLALIKDMVRQFLAEGPSGEELQQAKRELAGSFPLSTASNAAIVGQLGAIGFYDLPLDHLERFVEEVQSLSAEQVRAAMNRHLDPEAFVVVTVGPTVAQSELPPPNGQAQPQPTGVRH